MTHLPLRFPEKKLKRPSLFSRAGERGRSFSVIPFRFPCELFSGGADAGYPAQAGSSPAGPGPESGKAQPGGAFWVL